MFGRVELEKREKSLLQRSAALSGSPKWASREHTQAPDPFRTEFHRDFTRIIHSRAFRRLRHKTQVFIHPDNDHLCTRLEHSLHVASVAATIARAMGLNEDLVHAIAVGHDLGHPPFGHAGEKALDKIATREGLMFAHETQSLRVVDLLDSPYRPDYRGLNLTFAVRDGIVCHYGEGFERQLTPDGRKRPEDLTQTVRGKTRPATLEGCVVRWADKIAYLGRDLEDALAIGIVRRKDIPPRVSRDLGATNGEIIGSLVKDLMDNSDQQFLRVSRPIHRALNDLYEFNMDRIYHSRQATAPLAQVNRVMRPLFQMFKAQILKAQKAQSLDAIPKGMNSDKPTVLQVLRAFLEEDVQEWKTEAPAQLAVDYIAGMTDSFFMRAVNELFFPRGVV